MTKETLKARKDLTDQERQQIADDFVAKHMFIDQNSLVQMCLANDSFFWEDIENFYAVNDEGEEEPQEIYSWILVESFMANKLRAQGEPILDNDFGIWWGRTCYGQAYSSDSVIEDIALSAKYA